MFFHMNVRRRMPVLMPNIVKQEQPKQPQRQLVSVHVAPMVAPIVAPMVAPILIHEKNESGEICDNNKKQVIIYNIGNEDVEECFPLPVLEEPVIETLSKPSEIILLEMIEEVEEVDEVEEEVVHVHGFAEANVNKQVVQDIKKNNNKNSKNNNKKKNTKK